MTIYYLLDAAVSEKKQGIKLTFFNPSKNKWKEINLTDGDIVNFVNLKFLANHFGMTPDEIVDMRSKGRSFIEINQTFKQRKAAGKEKLANKKDQKKGKKKK